MKTTRLIRCSVVSFFLLQTAICTAYPQSLNPPSQPGKEWAPPKWEKSTKKADIYWKEIRGRKVSSTGGMKLGEIIDQSMMNNPLTRQAIDNARAAQAQMKQAESAWYPKISLQADITRNRSRNEWDVNEINNLYLEPLGELTYLLLDFGGRAARAMEGRHNLIAADYSYNQSVLDVILQAQIAYYSYYNAAAQLDASNDDLTDAQATYYAADQKLQAGIVTMLDVLQAKSQFQSALYNRVGRRGDLKTAKADLARAMGLPADAAFWISMPSRKTPPDVTKKDVSKVIDYALEKRPDISSQRASVRAMESSLAAANSDLWPTLNAGGTLNSRHYDYYGIDKNVSGLDKNMGAFNGYLAVNWDIFDGFEKYSVKKQAEALRDAEREKLRKAEIDASADVWNKFYAYKTAVSQLEASQALFDSSKESYKLAKQSYDAGLKSILDLLQSQNELSTSRGKLINSRVGVLTSLAQLAHSIGLMSSLVEDHSTPTDAPPATAQQ